MNDFLFARSQMEGVGQWPSHSLVLMQRHCITATRAPFWTLDMSERLNYSAEEQAGGSKIENSGRTSGLAAVFEEEQFAPRAVGEIKTDGAIAADVIARDAATGAHAVDLVDAEVSAHVELAPRFDENRAGRLVGKELFQRGTFVLDVDDRRSGFERVVVQARRLTQ